MSELRTEHFKALKEEHRQYLFQVQQLWFYKLSTIGLVIAAAIFNDKIINISGVKTETVVALGICTLPVLSFLIDLKALEVGLHVKLISRHLREKFDDIEEIQSWEANLWSGISLSLYRTWLTIGTALGTSFLVLIIAVALVYKIEPFWSNYLIIASVIFTLIAVITVVKIVPELLNTEKNQPAAPVD